MCVTNLNKYISCKTDGAVENHIMQFLNDAAMTKFYFKTNKRILHTQNV